MGRILIVDDSVLIRRNLRVLVETRTPHEVVGEAVNGNEGIAQYRALRPDLVTMDLNMPAMGGIEAIRLIRAEFPSAVIVAVSSISEREKILEALDAGVTNFVLKPVNSEHFLDVLTKLLSAC